VVVVRTGAGAESRPAPDRTRLAVTREYLRACARPTPRPPRWLTSAFDARQPIRVARVLVRLTLTAAQDVRWIASRIRSAGFEIDQLLPMGGPTVECVRRRAGRPGGFFMDGLDQGSR